MPRDPRRDLNRRTFGLAALAVPVLAACSSVPQTRPPVQPPTDPTGVTLVMGDQRGGIRSLLRAAGLDQGTPYRVDWRTFTSGPPMVEAARAGAIDMGQVGNTPAIFATAARARVQLVAASRGGIAGDVILVPGDSPIREVTDLRGADVAVGKGTSAHGQLLYALRDADMSLDDLELTYLAPSDAYGAFTQRRIDAWAVWDPFTAQAEIEAGARILVPGEGTANGLSFLVASNAVLAEPARQAATADMVDRIERAMRFADANRDVRARYWAEETGLPLEVTRRATERGPDLPVPMDDELITSQQALADAFTDAGVVPGRTDFGAFVDRRFG